MSKKNIQSMNNEWLLGTYKDTMQLQPEAIIAVIGKQSFSRQELEAELKRRLEEGETAKKKAEELQGAVNLAREHLNSCTSVR